MIGEEIKTRREAMGLTQTALASKMYVGQSMLAQVESGMKIPTVAMVATAAKVFGCTTDELIFGDERKAVHCAGA